MPARKPSVKIKVGINHSRSSFSVHNRDRRLPSECWRAGSARQFLVVLYCQQIVAPRVVLSPTGNGRARLTVCNAEMAWWCKRANTLV